MSTTGPITIQLLVRVLAVVCLIGGLVVFVSRRILLPHQKRALTLTEINTLLNRHENGGTGVVFRKWRKRIFPPPVFGDEDELAEAEREEQAEAEAAAAAQQGSGTADESIVRRNSWTFTSKPQPEGLRSCLRVHSESTALAPHAESTTTPSSSSSEAPSADSTSAEGEEPLPNNSASKPAKRVRIIEPELDELETLRELWSTPEMFALHGSNGIGGFRRTRDFYSKSQGGSAVVKRPTTGGASSTTAATTAESGSLIPATKADDEEGVPVVAETSSSRVKPIQRLQRDSLANSSAAGSSSTRQSSLSPAPTNRRHRTLSPAYASTSSGSTARSGSPAFIVGSQSSAAKASPSRRRALSPGVASSHHHGLRNASPSGPAGQGEGPRWVKARGTPSAAAAAAARSGKDSSSGAESSSAATGADSSEHETTDDDGESEAEPVSHSRIATAAEPVSAETVDGSATPPPSSFSSVLHTLTNLDALGPALEGARTSIREQHSEKVSAVESPAVSILSGGESPQESPTPAPHPTARRATSSAPNVAVTPSSPAPPAADHFLAPLPPLSDEAPPSPISPSPQKSTFSTAEASLVPTTSEKVNGHDFSSPSTTTFLPSTAPSSTASTTASSTAVSPSPCIAAQDRRLSLRVQQALRDKRQKRHGSPASIGSRGSGETISPPPAVPLSA